MATRGVFCIIKNEDGGNHILVSERADGKGWNLPGGRQEEGETDAQTAIREAKEELGLDVKVLCPVGIELHHKEDIAVAYLCKVIGGELTTTAEAKQHRFISSAETETLEWAGLRTLCMVLTGFYQQYYWYTRVNDGHICADGELEQLEKISTKTTKARDREGAAANLGLDAKFIHGPFTTMEELRNSFT